MEHKEDEVTTIYSTVPIKLYKPMAFQPFLHKCVFTALIYSAFIVINHYLCFQVAQYPLTEYDPKYMKFNNEIMSLYNK